MRQKLLYFVNVVYL